MVKKEFPHLDYAIVAKPHTPMYLMHKYWARKPHNVVSEYIKHYTKPGEIVLDPFCGSGPTPLEAVKLGRKAVGIDLNPVATFITRMTATPAYADLIKSAYEQIESKCKDEINELYETQCRKCDRSAHIRCTHWDKLKPIRIFYFCDRCNKILDKKPDEKDLKLIRKIEKTEISNWYPTQRLAYNGNDFKEGTHDPDLDSVDKLYTRRNLCSLALIFDNIVKIDKEKVKDLFLFAFTSFSHLASKMTPVRPTRQMSSFWAMHRYWVPSLFMESNVWWLFDSAINGKQGLIRGKDDSGTQIQYAKEARRFTDLNDGANLFIKTQNALELGDILPKNSVDYVFTDPPYGGAVQYFELSTLWASWLGMELKYNDEITVNRNQNKDFEYYHKMLRASFKEIYQVLKPGKYMTVTFHSTDIKVWNSIIKAVVMVGFKLEKIIYQPPARPSAKGLLQPYGSAVGDYYIRFRKPEKGLLQTEKDIDLLTYEMEVVDAAQRIIGERGEPTIYQHILNGIMADLQGGVRVPVGAKNVEKVLNDHIGKEFELISVTDDKGKKIGKKWWLKGADLSHFSQPTLSDRVERKVIEVLEHSIKASFDEILQAIFIEFPNALTPETERIRDVLKEYAITSDGKWTLKTQVRIRESQHSEMIYYLALLGAKTELDVWIGQREQGDIYNKKKLSSLITRKNPVWRYINSMNVDRVRQIDVIWHDMGKVKYLFEVENTTAITDALVRGANVPDSRAKRLIVIPEERERFLFRKMKEPLLNESVIKNNWKFIFYKDVEKYFNENKKCDGIDLEDFEKLFKLPEDARQGQETLDLGI